MRWWLTFACALGLVACGGGGPAEAPGPRYANVEGAGRWVSVSALSAIGLGELAAASAAQPAGMVSPRYAVQTYRLVYTTVDGWAQPVSASALLVVPQKEAGKRSPLVSYQHGTIAKDALAPSNQAVASEPAVLLASLGYIVAAPDYVGYGVSKGREHPYLLAAPSAAVVNDMLVAVRYWLQTQGNPGNGQLFLAGYSEGAYVSMAAHRALQQSQSDLLAGLEGVAIGAGPYNVDLTLNHLLERIRQEDALLGALVNPGLLKYLGSGVRSEVRNRLLDAVRGDGADVAFQSTFLDYFLADDAAALQSNSNVHDWLPAQAVALFHGKADPVVSYNNALVTRQAMQARGAGSWVSLTDCSAAPADHQGCVVPYFRFLRDWLQGRARDL